MIYLPYPDYRRSAKCLSDVHLREQRNFIRDAIQILTIPGRLNKSGVEVTVWEGHMTQLLFLCDATLEERRRRGTNEKGITPWMLDHGDPAPTWIGDKVFHDRMKRLLLKKDPKHYGKMHWSVS